MPYICYVYGRTGHVPHMEVLPDVSLAEAHVLARGLLLQRPHCSRAELWDGEALVADFKQQPSALLA